MKKLMCVAMALTMLLALSLLVVATETTQRVYCDTTGEDWSICNIYWWNSASDPQWPGVAMEQDAEGIWYYDLPAGVKDVIFNNKVGDQGVQTGNLTVPDDGKNQYNLATSGWSEYGEKPKVENKTVTAVVPADWTEAYLYVWIGNGEIHAKDWPGELMTPGEDGTYSLTVPARYENAIITAGEQGPQTVDVPIKNYQNDLKIILKETNAEEKFEVEVEELQPAECEHTYTEAVTTAATCEEAGVKTFTCSKCDHTYTEPVTALGHDMVNGTCTRCGLKEGTETETVWYLVGYINGADYGIKDDSSNMGDHKFVNGKATVTFTADSYVLVKNAENTFYTTEAYTEETTAKLITDGDVENNKMKAPKGTLTFSLTENTDGTLTLSYTTSTEAPDPTDPSTPATPSDPTDPSTPTTPSDPTDPSTPTTPSKPTTPTEPAERPLEDFPLSNFRVVGNAPWMGDWDPASDAGRMRQTGANEYKVQFKNVKAGTYEFKITQNGTWDRCWGKPDNTNETFSLSETSDVIITFKLDGEQYSIHVATVPATGDVDVVGLLALMAMALSAASVLILNRKKFLHS